MSERKLGGVPRQSPGAEVIDHSPAAEPSDRTDRSDELLGMAWRGRAWRGSAWHDGQGHDAREVGDAHEKDEGPG